MPGIFFSGKFCPLHIVCYVLSGIFCPGILCLGIFCPGIFCPDIFCPVTNEDVLQHHCSVTPFIRSNGLIRLQILKSKKY